MNKTIDSPEEYQVYHKAPLEEIKAKYLALVSKVEGVYLENQGIESQKDFALSIKGQPFSPILFSLRAGKTPSVTHWLSEERNFNAALDLLNIPSTSYPLTSPNLPHKV